MVQHIYSAMTVASGANSALIEVEDAWVIPAISPSIDVCVCACVCVCLRLCADRQEIVCPAQGHFNMLLLDTPAVAEVKAVTFG